MDDDDVALRNATYASFADLGRAPSADEVSVRTGRTPGDVLAGWRRLHAAHALVLEAGGGSIRMANPFSGVPTAHRVQAAGRWWYANCAWDAVGICAALDADGRIESSCPDCGEPLAFQVRNGAPDRDDLLFHCLVPARSWWDDIVFTQGSMNLFRSGEHIRRWLGDRPAGVTLPLSTLAALARDWWGDRLAPGWRPHSRQQNQAILDRLHLVGAFWQLS